MKALLLAAVAVGGFIAGRISPSVTAIEDSIGSLGRAPEDCTATTDPVLALAAFWGAKGAGAMTIERYAADRRVTMRVPADDDSVAETRTWIYLQGTKATCGPVLQRCARGMPWETAFFHAGACP